MKVRQGFVSNSSTTSFCVAGCYVDEDDIIAYYRTTEDGKDLPVVDIDVWEAMDSVYKGGLSSYRNEYDEHICVGLSIDKMQDEETKKEFILRAEAVLKKYGLMKPEDKASFITDGWYNG